MGTTLLLFLIPLVAWILIAKLLFKHEFTIEEMGIQVLFTAAVLALLSFAGYSSMTDDTMMVNGAVTKLNPRTENCDTSA